MTQEQIAGIFIILIALAILIVPKQVWKLAESWKNKEKVPPSGICIETGIPFWDDAL